MVDEAAGLAHAANAHRCQVRTLPPTPLPQHQCISATSLACLTHSTRCSQELSKERQGSLSVAPRLLICPPTLGDRPLQISTAPLTTSHLPSLHAAPCIHPSKPHTFYSLCPACSSLYRTHHFHPPSIYLLLPGFPQFILSTS